MQSKQSQTTWIPIFVSGISTTFRRQFYDHSWTDATQCEQLRTRGSLLTLCDFNLDHSEPDVPPESAIGGAEVEHNTESTEKESDWNQIYLQSDCCLISLSTHVPLHLGLGSGFESESNRRRVQKLFLVAPTLKLGRNNWTYVLRSPFKSCCIGD